MGNGGLCRDSTSEHVGLGAFSSAVRSCIKKDPVEVTTKVTRSQLIKVAV